jgi:hypothetical protein
MSKSSGDRGKRVPRVIDSASDHAGMQRILRRALKRMSKSPGFTLPDGQMLPPWLEIPEYERLSLGWRMGGGEDYYRAFVDFYKSLSEAEREAYAQRYPEPEKWANYYEQLVGA